MVILLPLCLRDSLHPNLRLCLQANQQNDYSAADEPADLTLWDSRRVRQQDSLRCSPRPCPVISFKVSKPTTQPSSQPTAVPSSQPSSEPSMQPTGAPTGQPTSSPTNPRLPTSIPTASIGGADLNKVETFLPWRPILYTVVALTLVCRGGYSPLLQQKQIQPHAMDLRKVRLAAIWTKLSN